MARSNIGLSGGIVIHSVVGDVNYERGALDFQSSKLRLVYEAGGTGVAARDIEIVTNGHTFTLFSNGGFTVDGSVTAGAGGGSALVLSSRSKIQSASDGVLSILNNAGSDFNRLQFGGTTSSFPALKRSTTVLETKLADDSAYTYHQAAAFIPNPTATGSLPGSPPEGAIFYDTTLNKLKFWNGAAYETVTSA